MPPQKLPARQLPGRIRITGIRPSGSTERIASYIALLRPDDGAVPFPDGPFTCVVVDRILGSQLFVDVYPQARSFVDVHISLPERRAARKDFYQLIGKE